MMWLVLGSITVFFVVLIGVLATRSTPVQQRQSQALLIPFFVGVLGVVGYGFIGLNPLTPEWVAQQQAYREQAQTLLAGDVPEQSSDISPDVLVRVLQNQLTRAPSVEGWQTLAMFYDHLGAPAQSADAARRGLLIDDQQPDLHLLLAKSLISEADGKLTEASRSALEETLVLVPEHDGAQMMLAMAATRAGDFPLAEQAWQALLTRHRGAESEQWLQMGLAKTREAAANAERYGRIAAQVDAEDLSAGGTLFVFVREKGVAGQPLAAKRVLASQFPLTVSLAAENWLQDYPDDTRELVIGARYTPLAGQGVDQAAVRTETQPLPLPQRAPASLVLRKQE